MNKKVYIEAGALDGVGGSRSLQYKNDENYFGILVEPTKDQYDACVSNRSNSNTAIYNCALVPLDYPHTEVRMKLSTTHPGMNTCEIVDISNLVTHTYSNEYAAKARTLQSILDEHNIQEIEMFFLDVEGAEKSVIDGLDSNKTTIKFLEIELHHWRVMTLEAEIKMHEDNLQKFNMKLDQMIECSGGYKLYFKRVK